MYKLLLILLLSFSFTQEHCEGHCLSQEELNGIMDDMNNLEFKLKFSKEEIVTLNSMILDYEKNDSLSISLINDYKNQLQWKEEMIDLVKPKWYDNKYLWFFGGIVITSGAVYLAGQID